MKFKKHVFVCLNERTDGRDCCGQQHGEQLVQKMKALVKEAGLKEEIRINKAGCLDACAYGPVLVVYPEGAWYGDVQPEDVEEIFEKHLLQGELVERLLINFKAPARKWLKTTRNGNQE